jgi:hypothetical protein
VFFSPDDHTNTLCSVGDPLDETRNIINHNLNISHLELEEHIRSLKSRRNELSLISGTAFLIHDDFLYDIERLQRVELVNCRISWDSRFLSVGDLTHKSLRLFNF